MTDDIEGRTLRKIERRLIYFCMLLFILNYVDRLNVGFAALRMNQDLNFGPTVYGIGAGIFFFGYFFFEIPSNLIWSMFGVFWAVPADFLSGTAAAGGFALINSFGTLGGFLGPFLVGFVRQHTGSFTGSLLVLAGFTLMAAVISATLPRKMVR